MSSVLQLLSNGIVGFSSMALVALGFALIYRVGRFIKFTHAAVFTVAPYIAFSATGYLHCPLWAAAALGIIGASVVGVVADAVVHRPLRQRNAAVAVHLLASLGMYVLIQNGISLLWGDSSRSLRMGNVAAGMVVFDARITPAQLLSVGTAFVLVTAFAVVLSVTPFGRTLRAVASSHVLAETSGLAVGKTILYAVLMGSALAATAGVLVALDVGMHPTMGMNALMTAFVVAMVGRYRTGGVVLAALLVAGTQQATGWYFGAQWQDVGVFLVLVAALLLKGSLGNRRRTGDPLVVVAA